MNSYIDNIVYLLINTTGESLDDDFIFKIDAIKFANGKKEFFSSFINVSSDNFIFNSNYLPDHILDKIKEAPSLKETLNKLFLFIDNFKIIMINNKNQIEFLKRDFFINDINLNNHLISSFEFFFLIEPWHFDYSLEYLLKIKKQKEKPFYDITSKDFLKVFNSFLIENDIGDFISHYGLYLQDWNLYEYLINFNISEELFKEKNETSIPSSSSHESPTLNLLEDCEEILKSKEGFNLISPKFKFRKAQYDVMKNVRESLDKDLISIIEAPTGTGKSIAYLLPAISKAYFNGKRTFISTNTKELQRQLIHKDIPFLINSFNLDHKVDIVNIKGKSNYLCVDIIQSLLNDTSFDETKTLKENMSLVFLHRYCYGGKAGDREEINYDVSLYLKLENTLRFCLCDSDGCNIKSCVHRCYYKNVVEALKTSTIVIVNHSLLLKWPYESSMENVIIDEAHNLSDSIFDAYAATLNSKETKSLLLEILDYNNKKGYLNYVWKHTPNRLSNFREIIRDKIDVCFRTMDNISFTTFKENENSYDLDVTFHKDSFHSYGKMVNDLKILKEDLLDFYSALKKFIDGNNLDNKKIKNRGEVLIKKVDRVKELIDFIDLFTTLEQDNNKCYGLFIEKNNRYWECYIKDLSSSLIFFERFLNNLKSCTFLSATLKNNNTYNGFKNSLAIDKVNPKFLREVKEVKNSFDIKARSIIFSPTDCPRYYDGGFIKYMVNSTIKILENSSSNILILFTSKKRLNLFKDTILPYALKNKINIFYRKQDIKRLSLNSHRSILLGSKGFFEGIDIPGDLLNIVLMDKMPNINPYNPLFSKFLENGYSFKSINTPRATIAFKQCFGRLIRSELDYGYFIIFDKCGQNSILENISSEYSGLQFVNSTLNDLLNDLTPRFKYWNALNLDYIIKKTSKDLANYLKREGRYIYGNTNNLENALNLFYEEKFKELNLNKNIVLYIRNKKILFYYLRDKSYLNIPNKDIIIQSINNAFND